MSVNHFFKLIFGDDADAEAFRLGELAARVLAREDEARLLRHRAGGLAAVALDDGAGLVAGIL